MRALIAGVLVAFALSASASTAPTPPAGDGLMKATFAAGCFWCVEGPYDKLDGVISTTSGYIGGKTKNPSYRAVSAGITGHTEAVEVVYDPSKVSYEKLLEVFWINVDPTTADRQFCDVGSQYRPGIFWHGKQQKKAAIASREAIDKSERFTDPVVIEITEASTFYAAEDYHQDYYLTNPRRYQYYRWSCGRDKRLDQLWGELRDK
jgi:peptide-methionine (S)-S-oxide reductase